MPKLLRAIQPNAGVRAYYRRRLKRELEAMQRSIAYWLEAAYKAREGEIVQDASPTNDILSRFKALQRRWLRRWNWLASWLPQRVIDRTERTTTVSMAEAFKAAGFTVKMDNSRVFNSVTQALIAENVALIKSIPQQYLSDVEGIVTRGVSMGKDLHYITEELHKRYDITRRRAAFIARDQMDKASMSIQKARDEQLGITEGIWVHLPGQKTSRATHIAMNGKRFPLQGPNAGLYDSAVKKNVMPAELPGCRCVYRRVLPELGELGA